MINLIGEILKLRFMNKNFVQNQQNQNDFSCC